MEVTVYEHIDFGGRSQNFGPGVYRADQGKLNIIGNDTISSVKVPFGLCCDLFEQENNGQGSGRKITLQPVEHQFVGDEFNDKASLIIVYPFTDVYLSTDDPSVPSRLSFFLFANKGSNS